MAGKGLEKFEHIGSSTSVLVGCTCTCVVDIALAGKHIEEKFGQIAPSGVLWGPVGFWNLASFLFIHMEHQRQSLIDDS